jgi:hypothetical protein
MGGLVGVRRLPPRFSGLGDEPGVPAGYMSQVIRHFRFSGDMYRGVTISLCEPFCYIGVPATRPMDITWDPGLSVLGSIDGSTVTEQTPWTMGLNPYRGPMYIGSYGDSAAIQEGISFADSTFLANIAQSFTDFRVKGTLKLHYRPLVPTADTHNFILAVSNDGAHPIVGVSQFQSLPTPTFAKLDNGITSISFASWMPWSCEWPIDNSPKKMYQVPQYNMPEGAVMQYSEADTRMCNFGSIACLSSDNTGSDSATLSGQLYWEYEVEFLGPYPVSTQVFGLSRETVRVHPGTMPIRGLREEKKRTAVKPTRSVDPEFVSVTEPVTPSSVTSGGTPFPVAPPRHVTPTPPPLSTAHLRR